MEDGPLHYLVNDQPPIHGPDSGNGTKQGVSHGQANLLRLVRIEDGHEIFEYSPLSKVPAVPRVEAVLRVQVRSKLPRKQPVSASGPSFSLSSRKPVNPSPCIRSPIIRVSLHSPYPLVPSLELEFSQGIFRSEVQGLASNPSQPITRRSSANAYNSESFFGIAGMTALSGIGMGSLAYPAHASGILLPTLNLYHN